MVVEIRKLDTFKTENTCVQVDYDFLNTGWVRRIYMVTTDVPQRIPATPHAHEIEQYFFLLSGQGLLAWKNPEGQIHRITLDTNCYYVIPPLVPHQIRLVRGILETFYPRTLVAPNTIIGNEDFFDPKFKNRYV